MYKTPMIRTQATAPLHLISALAAGFVLIMFSGCSEMQFVGQTELVPEKDPREDIVLTSVSTEMTSAGVVQQRIGGSEAVFSEAENELTIRDISVTTLAENGATQSLTRADVGQIYFADRPLEKIGRRDMKFAGHVLYRNPQKDDPTTDSLQLTSELIVWDESEEKFISPTGYEMLLLPKGKKPVRQRGKGFEATQDLSRFVVKAGSVTTDMDTDPAEDRKEMEDKLNAWKKEAEEKAAEKLDIPLTIPIGVQ